MNQQVRSFLKVALNMRLLVSALLLLASPLLASCQWTFGYEELKAGDQDAGLGGGSGGVAGGNSGGTGGDTEPCPELQAPETGGTLMKKIKRINGTCFFMDQYEVSRGQYLEFVQLADGGTPVQSAECSWNEQLTDSVCEEDPHVTKSDQHPMVCVDQCDAQAYCDSVGKKLCSGHYTLPTEPAQDDWYAACSNNKNDAYPTTGAAEDFCNLEPAGNGTTRDVDEGINCTNSAGIFDLLGNVWEWVDACSVSSGATAKCLAHGASFIESSSYNCTHTITRQRNETAYYLGFRCCSK